MEPAFLAKPPKSSSSSSSSSRPTALKGTSRRTGATNTFQDLQASLVRAGMRRAGMPGAGCCKVEPTTSSVGRQEYPSVPPPAAVSKQGRGSRAPSETSRESGRVTTSNTAAAAAAVPAKWVWGQGPEEEEAEKGPQHRQPHLAPVAHDLGGDAASKPPPPPGNIDVLRKKMFADSSSSSFESTCSTEAMTESTTSSPKDANWDAPFLSRLSDMSMKFPEPPTRPPAETTPPSSRALTISGLGKNITSSLPSVQLLMPLRWRKRVRATGSNKRCRKSTSRWIARSKATSSMSETSLLARALSMNDNGVHRGKEAAAPGAKPTPSSFAVESAVVMTPPRRRGVSKVAGGTPRQLSDLSEVNEQQEEELQEEEEEARSVCDPPCALPTPVPHPAVEKSPPPAPLHTAPRPPAPQKQQRYNVAALLAARHSSRLRRNCFASSPSAAGTDETCFASSPSSLSPPPYMTIKNRLASSSSSIFEEDGDDNKKTLFLNPYSRSPLPPPAAAAAGDAPRTSAGGAKATAAAAAKKNKPGATHDPTSSSDSWVWRGRSSNNPTNMQQQQKQQQHRHSLFATGAPVDGVRRRAAVTALQVEANRQFGDRRRRVKDGESGIWLPSPGIWSSARRPTPLNADLFSAW
ncbi:unnamed protein product [Ectocarpus fasciculatus]